MKRFSRRAFLAGTALTLAAPAIIGRTYAASNQTHWKFLWSHYTGWEPLQYAKDAKIFEKWGAKYGVTIELVDVMKYDASLQQFSTGEFCGIAITNMDALLAPAAGGVDTTIIDVGDSSHGNDGVLVKYAKGKPKPTLHDLKGKTVGLVAGGVSEYLLA